MHPEFFTNEWILIYGGLALTLLIVFAETAFPIGVIIPGGELLLLLTGLIVGSKWVDVNILFVVIPVSLIAFIGDLLGYTIGHKIGPSIFTHKDSLFFKKKFIRRAERFMDKYEVLSYIIAHFFHIIRTYVPLLSGAKEKNFTTYFIFTGIGCLIYVNLFIVGGYFLGKLFPILNLYLRYIIGAVIAFIFITPLISLIRAGISKSKGENYSIEE